MAGEAVKIPFIEAAAPSTPAANRVALYAKSDGLLYSKDDAGTETLVSGGAGGGAVATDAIWDAKGDLAGGTGANTAVKLTVGSNGTVLTADSGETTGMKWATPGSGALTLITDTLLGGDTATFDFTSISGSYKHLRLEIQARTTESAGQTWIKLTFNNDTGSNYDGVQTQQYVGSSESGFNEDTGATSCAHAFYACGDTAPTSEAAAVTMTIPNYASTTFFKSFVASGYLRLATGSGGVRHIGSGGNWRSTAAITRITLTPTSGNFKTGSRASLYGIS